MVLEAVLGGFVLDALFGDPAWLPHPVVLMGRCISRLEKFLRARLPGTPQGELLGGAVTAFCLPVGTFLVTSLVCLAAAKLSPWLGLAVQMFWCGQALAARGLAQESTNVYNELVRNDLPAARKAVSRIVGRDTQNLTAEGVTKAAVETVAENASDGVIAPLLYMLIGGAPLALTYKAINTMDSMLGYKTRSIFTLAVQPRSWTTLPTTSPAALPPFLWVAAAAFTGNDAKGAWRIWRRDRRNHASPNSAQTESACAGALGVQLAGPAYYFGEYYPKPTIGDALRPIEPQDILRANRMMYVASGFALAWGAAIRGFLHETLDPWRRLGGLPRRVWPRPAGFFRPMSVRWACRKGWQRPLRRALPRPTATPTRCAGPCVKNWRWLRECPPNGCCAATARQTSSSGWRWPQSPALHW